jgi:hypothetical protein
MIGKMRSSISASEAYPIAASAGEDQPALLASQDKRPASSPIYWPAKTELHHEIFLNTLRHATFAATPGAPA